MRKEYLKIINNIDLDILEKLGFEKTAGEYNKFYAYEELLVNIKDRKVVLFKLGEKALIKFFDLCRIGIVEKVVEDDTQIKNDIEKPKQKFFEELNNSVDDFFNEVDKVFHQTKGESDEQTLK